MRLYVKVSVAPHSFCHCVLTSLHQLNIEILICINKKPPVSMLETNNIIIQYFKKRVFWSQWGTICPNGWSWNYPSRLYSMYKLLNIYSYGSSQWKWDRYTSSERCKIVKNTNVIWPFSTVFLKKPGPAKYSPQLLSERGSTRNESREDVAHKTKSTP